VSLQPYLQEGIYEFTEFGLLRKMSGTICTRKDVLSDKGLWRKEGSMQEGTYTVKLLFVYALKYKLCGNVLQKLPTDVLKQRFSTGVPRHIGFTLTVSLRFSCKVISNGVLYRTQVFLKLKKVSYNW
jgi:hypothetical protein